MKSLLNETKLPFLALAKARERMDDSDDGMGGRCGNWELGLGGYDHGYEIYYKGSPIGRVNYELREYELYHEDFMPKELIPEFLTALDARGFKDVGYHEHNDEDFDDDGPRYVQESIGNLESFLAEKEKKFKPSRVNPSWDESENKVWAVEEYLSMMGGFTDEDREYLRETDPELLSLEENEDDDQDMFNEDGVKKRKLTGARSHITKDGMRGWTWDPKRDGYYITKNDFPEQFMDKFVPFLKGLRNEHCELDMWANSKNRLFIRWVGEKTKDKHWWHKLNINGSPANHEMASFAQESLKEFVEEIEKFIGKSDLADVIQVKLNWRFWEGDCKDKSCNIGGKVGSINFLSELEPKQVKNFYDNMDTYAMLESRKVNESRKQIMWAINFRNMHTGVHGLYYGKDRRRVEEFAREIEDIYTATDMTDEDIYNAWESLYADYPDIATMEEFNYRDIVDLPGGYEGIEDGDTIYRFVNRVAYDIYNESTGKQKMKSRKIVKESEKFDKWEYRELIDRVEAYGRACKHVGYAEGAWGGTNKGLEKSANEAFSKVSDFAVKFIVSESTKRNNKMKFKKIVKEADDGKNYTDDTPKIYVGTYAKYNDGSIDGKWITISDYNTYEEFVDACRELHSDEDDPEFMVQDYENFPRKWYHEGGLPSEEEFDKINEFYMMDDDEKAAYEEYVDLDYGDDDIEAFREKYIGKFSSMSDFGYYLVENYGMPSENIDWYFDYEGFGRDLTMDWHQGDPDEKDYEGEPEDPDYYYDSDGEQMMPYGSDQEVAEQWVDDMGGVEQLGKETIDNYFDYEEFGRIVFDNDCSESNGYVFWSH